MSPGQLKNGRTYKNHFAIFLEVRDGADRLVEGLRRHQARPRRAARIVTHILFCPGLSMRSFYTFNYHIESRRIARDRKQKQRFMSAPHDFFTC